MQEPSNTSNTSTQNLSRFEQELSWCNQGCSSLKVLHIICIALYSLAFPRLACILLYVRESISITLHVFSIHYVDITSTMLHISFFRCSRGPSPSPFEGNCLHPGCRSLQTVQRISCHSDSQNSDCLEKTSKYFNVNKSAKKTSTMPVATHIQLYSVIFNYSKLCIYYCCDT